MAGTTIEWTDETWNPILGCDRVSPGCDHCYAIVQATIRAGNPHPAVKAAFAGLVERRDGRQDWTGVVNLLPERLRQPLGINKPTRFFVNSLADLFHDQVPLEFIAKIFAVMIACPHHTFQVLTKRHARMRAILSSSAFWKAVSVELGVLWKTTPPAPLRGVPPWIWIGVSVEDQHWADIRIPVLRATPATTRWVSAEPLLGPLTMPLEGIAWVVAGGESGPGARPMHPDWARSLRDQCADAGVAFLFKQWGAWAPVAKHFAADREEQGAWDTFVNLDGTTGQFCISEDHDRVTNWAGDFTPGQSHVVTRVGKTRAGRHLDGVVHDGYPAEWRERFPAVWRERFAAVSHG